MRGKPPIIVGQHIYSREDARRTLSCIDDLWAHHRHATGFDERWRAPAVEFLAGLSAVTGAADDAAPGRDAGHQTGDGADIDAEFARLQSRLTSAARGLDDERATAALALIWEFFPRLRSLDHRHVGVVSHLHASKGLPKAAIDSATVGWRGIEGDVQRARAHHGRPWQALCIWSLDALAVLRAEGHPISPGFAGENLTVGGIPSGAFRPGARFRAGSVEGFLTAYSIPCSQNSGWFADGDFERMSHERGDQSRIYAMITSPGIIEVGAPFELLTDR